MANEQPLGKRGLVPASHRNLSLAKSDMLRRSIEYVEAALSQAATPSAVDDGASDIARGASGIANAATLVVAPNGTAAFRTIQDAVDAASPGTRILVKPGRYAEIVRTEKHLEIVGDGTAKDIVIDGLHDYGGVLTHPADWRMCIEIEAASCSLRNLTLKGHVFVGGSAVIDNCIINAIDDGVGSSDNSRLLIRHSQLSIRGEHASAISIGAGAEVVIEDNMLRVNGKYATAISIDAGSTAIIRRNRIENRHKNFSYSVGIEASNVTAEISDNIISRFSSGIHIHTTSAEGVRLQGELLKLFEASVGTQVVFGSGGHDQWVADAVGRAANQPNVSIVKNLIDGGTVAVMALRLGLFRFSILKSIMKGCGLLLKKTICQIGAAV